MFGALLMCAGAPREGDVCELIESRLSSAVVLFVVSGFVISGRICLSRENGSLLWAASRLFADIVRRAENKCCTYALKNIRTQTVEY